MTAPRSRGTSCWVVAAALMLMAGCSGVAQARRDDVLDEPAQRPMNEPPVAVPTADVAEGNVPLTVCFDASKSYHPQRKPFDIRWDFGDGRGTASTTQACHEYIQAGLYAATVTVTDDRGLKDSRTVIISVRDER